jgi:ParB family chromosome partitioning protein
VTRCESFTALVREGLSVEQIGSRFGLPDLMVKRALALGNLLPRIRDLYRAEKISPESVRHLTLASKAQQRDWLALFDDKDTDTPTGYRLKVWLFGGTSIATRHALFDLESYNGAIVADLFGEDAYFADRDRFWTAQDAAVEARRDAYLNAGWKEVEIVPPGTIFYAYEHEHWPKREGGRVYIEVRESGEVVFHEGYVTGKEARKLEKGEAIAQGEKPKRPELTSTLQAYVDLHRHAVIRAELSDHPLVAMRLMVAHVIAHSPLWRVEADPISTRNDAVKKSIADASATHVFAERRAAVLTLLGLDPGDRQIVDSYYGKRNGAAIFARLLALDDASVFEILGVVMAETLACGSDFAEAAGTQIGIDMAAWWEADDALFDLIRDKAVLGAIVAEVAGSKVAKANADEKAKTLKTIIRNHLDGVEGRKKVEGWVPRWMRFAPTAYTKRGGVGTVSAARRIGAYPVAPEVAGPPDPEPVEQPAADVETALAA